MDTQTPFSGPSDEWVEMKLSKDVEEMRKRIAELEESNQILRDTVLDRDITIGQWLAKIEELEQENERLRSPCKTCKGRGYLNDAEPGDIAFHTWPCPDCARR